MDTSRQPLLTLSPSQHPQLSSPKIKKTENIIQTTPTLPRRERLASFSRLLERTNLLESSKRSLRRNEIRSSPKRCSQVLLQTIDSIEIRVSPCSPNQNDLSPAKETVDLVKNENGYLTPSCLPFSPTLLNRPSPIFQSPDYRKPSPVRTPLYSPDRQRIFLGRGAFGKVTLCKYKDSCFALKIVNHPSHFIGEENLLGIRHQHLVEVFYISNILDKTLIFMEFAGHCNLQNILDTKSELDFRRKLSFCVQIASGLRHCHQNNIVHGDVKPSNVMVSPLGICKLGDFGHSVIIDLQCDDGLSHLPYDVVGTATYAAPEVLKGSKSTTLSDIYSFGILLWQVHTREMPYAGEHPHVVIYKVVNNEERPKFPEDSNPIMLQYIKIAKECWNSDLSKRINANQALLGLQAILEDIKKGNKYTDN